MCAKVQKKIEGFISLSTHIPGIKVPKTLAGVSRHWTNIAKRVEALHWGGNWGGGGGDTTAWHSSEGLVPRGTCLKGEHHSTEEILQLHIYAFRKWKLWRSGGAPPCGPLLLRWGPLLLFWNQQDLAKVEPSHFFSFCYPSMILFDHMVMPLINNYVMISVMISVMICLYWCL